MLASTTPSASFSISSLGMRRGVLGRAVSPVRDDSKIPNGAIKAMKESIRAGFADLDEPYQLKTQALSIIGTLTAQQYSYSY